MGRFVYALTAVTCFALFLSVYIRLRNQPDGGNLNGSQQVAYGYLKILGIRAAAFLVFAVLAYLLLAEPCAQMNDGRVLFSGKGIDGTQITFADTQPGNFWFTLILNSLFGLFSIFFGAIFLIVNPRSKFWRRKSQMSIG